MINGHDMTNVKSALRRLYFIECMLAGNDEEVASAYSAKMMKALDGKTGLTETLDYVTDTLMTHIRQREQELTASDFCSMK